MTTTTPAPADTVDYALCYCDDGRHAACDRESKWRADFDAVTRDLIYYSPSAHPVRRTQHLEAVTS